MDFAASMDDGLFIQHAEEPEALRGRHGRLTDPLGSNRREEASADACNHDGAGRYLNIK